MTEIIENTDIDLTVLINWEEELSCEGYKNSCPNEVVWKAYTPCGCEFLFCDRCKNHAEENDNRQINMNAYGLRCFKCKTPLNFLVKRTFVPV